MMRLEADQAVLNCREEIVAALRKIVPEVGDSAALDVMPYESDALTACRQPPMVVMLTDTSERVSQVLKYCDDNGMKVVPRGSGTSLSGGSLPLKTAMLLGIGKCRCAREIDFENRAAVVEPGAIDLAVSQAVAHEGFCYAPDPSCRFMPA
jgi:glycolate oxidase